jgi:hypothetical protein
VSRISDFRWRTRAILALTLAILFTLVSTGLVFANVALTQISSDPYTNTTSYHATQVEPDTFSFGSTIVATFQSGRFQNGGASNIGWATSTDGGTSWTHGFLPGTTVFATPAGPYDRDTDPSVAFDARHNTWMISSLPLVQKSSGITGVAVIVSRSTNGGTRWGKPVTVAAATTSQDFDKNWTVCDNTPSSPHYGNCYTQWDDFGHLNQLHMATSSDGGKTWTEGTVPRHSVVIGGQPLVQPNGTVIVPIDNGFETAIESFVSTNGGASYSGPFSISSISSHTEAGNLRSGPLPTAEIDGAGKVYVVWSDSRFESNGSANDLVMSTSTDGITWTAVQRIPADPVGSGVDHFIPGLAVDKSTSGGSAHLGLTYYFYPNTNCTTSTCQLDVGFISSTNGGSTWTAPTQLAGPMTLTSLPLTSQGYMVGDYISTSFNSSGTAHGVFAVGFVVTGKTCTLGDVTSCNEPMFTNASGLAALAGSHISKGDHVVTSQSPGSSLRATH